jgi:predicted DNA-binding ribbon-helix-helix protein
MENKEQIQKEILRITGLVTSNCNKALESNKAVDVNSLTLSVLITELAEARAEISNLHKQIDELL